MTVAEKQSQLIADFSVIENRQERLSAVVALGRRRTSFPESARTETHRVQGCISHVWVIGERPQPDAGLRLQFDADSPLVKGLVALMIELYDGGSPDEIAATEPVLFDQLGLSRDLTPTRRNGLTAVRARIKAIAERLR